MANTVPMVLRSALIVGLAPIILLGLAGCGRVGGAPAGRVEDVVVRRQRHYVDTTRNQVRVFGEVANLGAGRVPAVAVRVITRNRNYDKTGENLVRLQDLSPGEHRTFSLAVTSHGRAVSVECRVEAPEP